jgi:hypothetical protein
MGKVKGGDGWMDARRVMRNGMGWDAEGEGTGRDG